MVPDELPLSELEWTNLSIRKLLDGVDPAALKAELDRALDPHASARIYDAALAQYSAAKQAGRLDELEYEIYFPKKKPASSRERWGLGLLAFGILATAISFFLAAPGATYTVYVGLIAAGIWLLVSA